jgi:predicted N-acetyltransferase YhbS
MSLLLRLERENDYKEVENLTREAFWDLYRPGCVEHLVLHNLRNSPAFLPELDFVAVENEIIVGNIVYSVSIVVDALHNRHEVLTFGPISVAPAYQRQGIGAALIEHTQRAAKELGYKGIFIYGNPAYYARFGFVNAQKYTVSTSDGVNFDAFMGMELSEGSLRGITGKFYEDPAFQVDQAELAEFEKGFPYKEKHVTDTQFS